MDYVEIKLVWNGPFGFNRGGDVPHFESDPSSRLPGIYLYTLKFDDAFRVNYVGKTDRDFCQRFEEEFKFSCEGKRDGKRFRSGPIVDMNSFLSGVYKETIKRPTPEDLVASRDIVHQMYAEYRLFVAELGNEYTNQVEGAITRHLYYMCDKCRKMMGYYSSNTLVHAGFPRVAIQSDFPLGVRVCGLEDRIQELSRSEYT